MERRWKAARGRLAAGKRQGGASSQRLPRGGVPKEAEEDAENRHPSLNAREKGLAWAEIKSQIQEEEEEEALEPEWRKKPLVSAEVQPWSPPSDPEH